MGTDRHSIIDAAEQMRSAVLVMEEIMRTAGRSELHRSGRLQIESDINILEENCARLRKAILRASLLLRDDWPEIESNKARLRETEAFLGEYQRLKATVLQFDDWRCDCYDKEDIFPRAHQVAMSMVLLCGATDKELEPTRMMLDEIQHGGLSANDPLMGFEKEMSRFCDIPTEGYLVSQIRHTFEPVFKATWKGAKNELALFADWYHKDSADIRKIFEFEPSKQSSTPFEISQHPTYKLQEDNPLKLLLKKYPREIFFE